ncbi:DUF397 domain-containing protein [Streptomyces sp. NPDC057499]|uniref:DUF397 domain-containing protein n=1 Tax=Streptomyces sp. NPDC057499 TaxID=3346150 RepID=UPI0036815003
MSDCLAQHDSYWRRSSRSTGMNNCVETAPFSDGRLAVRDSKDRSRAPLRFSATAWTAFVTGLHRAPAD